MPPLNLKPNQTLCLPFIDVDGTIIWMPLSAEAQEALEKFDTDAALEGLRLAALYGEQIRIRANHLLTEGGRDAR